MVNYLVRNVFCLIRKRFLQSSATLSSVPPLTNFNSPLSCTVQFLVDSCGIPLESALSVSKKFQLDEKAHRKAQAVLQLLKSHHFNDTHLAALIVKYPEVLRCRVKNNLQPKFEFLVQIGFQGELLPQIILSNPAITRRPSLYSLKSYIEFLRSVIGSVENVLVAVNRSPWLLTSNLENSVRPNIDFLLKEGVPADRVRKLLTLYPRVFSLRTDRIVNAANSIRNFGFETTDRMFIHGIRAMVQMSESTWKKKIEIMKSMGFDEAEILKAFKVCPTVLTGSEESLRSKMDFYLNTINLEPPRLIANPVLLRLSIEKRVRPRYRVFLILKSKKLIRDVKLRTFFFIGEYDFKKKYVDPFIDQVPGLLGVYLPIEGSKKIGP